MPRHPVVRPVLFVIAVASLLLSAPCFLLGVLGLLGIVADISPEENREAGLTFLGYGAIPAVIGVVLLLIAIPMQGRSAPGVDESDGPSAEKPPVRRPAEREKTP